MYYFIANSHPGFGENCIMSHVQAYLNPVYSAVDPVWILSQCCSRLKHLSCHLLQTSVGWGDGAGLEGAEACRRVVPGCDTGMHCPHQLLPWLHPGPHTGACSCLCHAPRAQVIRLHGHFGHCIFLLLSFSHIEVKLHFSFSFLLRVLSALAFVILSPAFTLLFLVFFFQELQEMPVSFQDGWLLYLSVISQGILDHYLYGSLVYPLIALLVYPCWLLFWNILFWN